MIICLNRSPVVEITAPDSHGLSKNLFDALNVDKAGLIINNSFLPGDAALGGFVKHNPNLAWGDYARLIVDEVVGTTPSIGHFGPLEKLWDDKSTQIASFGQGSNQVNTTLANDVLKPALEGAAAYGIGSALGVKDPEALGIGTAVGSFAAPWVQALDNSIFAISRSPGLLTYQPGCLGNGGGSITNSVTGQITGLIGGLATATYDGDFSMGQFGATQVYNNNDFYETRSDPSKKTRGLYQLDVGTYSPGSRLPGLVLADLNDSGLMTMVAGEKLVGVIGEDGSFQPTADFAARAGDQALTLEGAEAYIRSTWSGDTATRLIGYNYITNNSEYADAFDLQFAQQIASTNGLGNGPYRFGNLSALQIDQVYSRSYISAGDMPAISGTDSNGAVFVVRNGTELAIDTLLNIALATPAAAAEIADMPGTTSDLRTAVLETETSVPGGGTRELQPLTLGGPESGVMATREGIIGMTEHLASMDSFAGNDAMVARITGAFENGEALTGADANFYQHELFESGLMNQGMSYEAAHAAALQNFGVSPFSLYHPDVIGANPTLFNNAYRAFWGIGQ